MQRGHVDTHTRRWSGVLGHGQRGFLDLFGVRIDSYFPQSRTRDHRHFLRVKLTGDRQIWCWLSTRRKRSLAWSEWLPQFVQSKKSICFSLSGAPAITGFFFFCVSNLKETPTISVLGFPLAASDVGHGLGGFHTLFGVRSRASDAPDADTQTYRRHRQI